MAHTEAKGTALVTGASSGIGKVYAQRLAARGYDLVIVARNKGRLDDLAADLARSTGRKVDVLAADLGKRDDVRRVAERIRDDAAITLLVNNAGSGTEGPVLGADIDRIEAMVDLNVVALNRLAVTAVNAFSARGKGTLVNVASVVAFVSDHFLGAYAGTKAFVLGLTQSLQSELKDTPVRVQAVLPGYTRTEFFGSAGIAEQQIPAEMMMSAEDLVDAALAGLDQGELITIPSMPDVKVFEAYDAARLAMVPDLSRDRPAARYGIKDDAVAA
ncbi:SDR family oxidoreductase [Starkeya sp. ORNL1]|uniref:SDR family NAD(P)-dependent oxidoreductase n=1 Tax=Starkeya sp. ORNL1 TaxID=2709380 RepID=UPI001463C452|nr:SDR family oxidoreductase [Starkeya sp. ORNL1]QJP13107.1 SDR family oxidoreductase [Starkeya sp. ORNL1]